jgi:Flp pilus assembly protein TadG
MSGARLESRSGAQRGDAMVEFAIILPLLLLLVFGIIEFGRAYNTQLTLTHAAREGVREYALTKDADAGIATARDAATTLDPALMAVSVSACTSGSATTLSITYPFQLFIPFFPSTPITLAAEGTMRCGG